MLVSLLYSVSASTTYIATYDLNYSLWHGGPHPAQICFTVRKFSLVIICQQSSSSSSSSSSAAAAAASSTSLLTAQQSHTCSQPSPAQTPSAAAYVSPVSHRHTHTHTHITDMWFTWQVDNTSHYSMLHWQAPSSTTNMFCGKNSNNSKTVWKRFPYIAQSTPNYITHKQKKIITITNQL